MCVMTTHMRKVYIRKNIYFKEEDYEQLLLLAEDYADGNISAFVRFLLKEFLKRKVNNERRKKT
jgi:hypothetical protein